MMQDNFQTIEQTNKEKERKKERKENLCGLVFLCFYEQHLSLKR